MPSRKGHEILIFLQLFVMIKDNPCRCIWLRFCLYCFTCCLCVNLQAQQAGDSITGKVHAIPEVGIKGRRVPQRISVAMPIQVLEKNELENLGLQNIADAVCRSQCKRLWWYRRIKDCFRPKPWRYTHSSSLRWSGCEQHPSGTNRYRTFCIG